MMGWLNTDGGILAGSLDLPVPWNRMNNCLQAVEVVLDLIQIAKV